MARASESAHKPHLSGLLRLSGPNQERGIELTERTPRRPGRARPMAKDDPLMLLVGSGRSGIPGGISGKKHAYLGRERTRG